MPLEVASVDRMQQYLCGVLGRADHHAEAVQDIALALVGAVAWRKVGTLEVRTYALQHGITFRFFTLDAQSVAFVGHSDPSLPFGLQPQTGAQVAFADPTNQQSSRQTIRDFIDAGTTATA